ncbi:alpha-amylase family glycosyl hydrolase [Thalassoglobus polymorphus]|uniref:Amylosucrase n=1 Tax=Thalassoglobus polymorphus TaxID=2527994 RepID=A0A517QHV3_9PLAN|nr:alpha-amylase family glycosyl hydrolase [Thalassoglobus polymorphus]QDT31213.1 Amylosucrase [Thalassoglobus polymorphus]
MTISNNVPGIEDLKLEAELSLQRIWPRVCSIWEQAGHEPADRRAFEERFRNSWPRIFDLAYRLYGTRYDFFYHLEDIARVAAQAWADRPAHLLKTDQARIYDDSWFQSEQMVGGALYVDLFSENLGKLRQSIDYFKKLGVTYLHLMPLFAVRPGNNDGGYAISNYRSVDPRLGTIEDLQLLASELHESGIALALDFVFNHTADDHEWAKQAQAGVREFQQYYYLFEDRTLPDQYEQTLREIFPTESRGNFTWHDGMQRWVWTTFNSFQWDLNYHNPAVFCSMLEEMLFLANMGVDILRLDAVAFIWKQMGTSCENLPEAHILIQAYNAIVHLVCPGMVFKSEAIVAPDDVLTYVSPQECQLSYNPTLMALLWESLATREVKLLNRSLSHRHKIPSGTAWVNYLRCHDDIGWTFDDGDAAAVGINGYDHRQFLNKFYTGQYPESFARGVPFQYNADTGDMRISGTMASLAGLEQAFSRNDDTLKELAVNRILLLHGITLSIGGIPLLYIGEEWGLLNDYDFVQDPAKSSDTRWIHRPKMKWDYLQDLQLPENSNGQGGMVHTNLYNSIRRLIHLRKVAPAFAGQQMELISSGNPHVLGFVRHSAEGRVIVFGNFSEEEQPVSGNVVRTAGLGRFFEELISETTVGTSEEVILGPYQVMWLRRV